MSLETGEVFLTWLYSFHFLLFLILFFFFFFKQAQNLQRIVQTTFRSDLIDEQFRKPLFSQDCVQFHTSPKFRIFRSRRKWCSLGGKVNSRSTTLASQIIFCKSLSFSLLCSIPGACSNNMLHVIHATSQKEYMCVHIRSCVWNFT